MKKRGVTKFLRFLIKGYRRYERAQKQHGFDALLNNLLHYRQIMMQKRMAVAKIRKFLWKKIKQWKRRGFKKLVEADLGFYVVKLQYAYRKRLYNRHAMARVIETHYRRHRDIKLANKRRKSIHYVAA